MRTRNILTELVLVQADPLAPRHHAVEEIGAPDVFKCSTIGPALYTAEQLIEFCRVQGAELVLLRWREQHQAAPISAYA